MTEHDLIGGLADIEEQLKTGNANHEKLHARLGELITALREQKAPTVEVPVTVEAATTQQGDWYFTFQFDGLGRPATMRATRVKPGSAT